MSKMIDTVRVDSGCYHSLIRVGKVIGLKRLRDEYEVYLELTEADFVSDRKMSIMIVGAGNSVPDIMECAAVCDSHGELVFLYVDRQD